MQKRIHQTGFTLIELMVTLSLVSLLLLMSSLNWSNLIARQEIRTELRYLSHLISLARSEAITRNESVTICGSSTGRICDGNWNGGAVLQITNRLDEPDVIYSIRHPLTHITVEWHGRGRGTKVVVNALGIFEYSNGHFLLCPKSGDKHLVKSLFLSTTGRVRET